LLGSYLGGWLVGWLVRSPKSLTADWALEEVGLEEALEAFICWSCYCWSCCC